MVLPLVFMFLMGTVWFGRAFNIYSTITQAAQQGAITAARASCATCGNDPASDGTVVAAVTAVLQASNLDPNQIVPSSSPPTGCTTPSNIVICRDVQLNQPTPGTQPQFCNSPPSGSEVCGTSVSFRYPFQFHVPFSSLNSVTLAANAQSRLEQ